MGVRFCRAGLAAEETEEGPGQTLQLGQQVQPVKLVIKGDPWTGQAFLRVAAVAEEKFEFAFILADVDDDGVLWQTADSGKLSRIQADAAK